MKKTVKDDEGNSYEIELDDEGGDEDDEEDEDDENIYLTEADLRWLKEQRKGSGSPPQKDKRQKPSGIAVKKKPGQKPPTSISSKKSRVRRLTLSA